MEKCLLKIPYSPKVVMCVCGFFSDSLGHQHIGNLIIPGTHNSACCGGAPFFTKDYVLNQDRTIWEQLVFGIRYLDLRIACYFEVDDRPA